MLLATAAEDKVNLHFTCALSIVLRAHPFPFRAKLVLLGFFPATKRFKSIFSLWLLAKTQGCVSKLTPKLCRTDPGEGGVHNSRCTFSSKTLDGLCMI